MAEHHRAHLHAQFAVPIIHLGHAFLLWPVLGWLWPIAVRSPVNVPGTEPF
jgi:hypothetical protein